MAREKEKKGYQGYKLGSDSKQTRDEVRRRQERAEKNSLSMKSNEMFALENPEFKAACEKAGVNATARQASKFRQPAPYGSAARAAGISARRDPRA
jgi:hypothetical protein